MFGFYLKKAFFDGWDNFIQMILQNLVYVGIFALGLGAMTLFGETNALVFYITMALFMLLLCIALGGSAAVVKNYSDYNSETWGPFFKGLKRNLGHSLFFFVLVLLLVFIISFVMPFYLSMENFFGNVAAIILFWALVALVLSVAYYFPLMNLLPGDGPLKTLKKCFLFTFDNPGFTFLLFLHNLVDVILSVVTMGIFTGVTGVMLGSEDATKLLMKKYDWLEENPGKTRKDIDWDELLFEEKEAVGPRSFKSMIFPWK